MTIATVLFARSGSPQIYALHTSSYCMVYTSRHPRAAICIIIHCTVTRDIFRRLHEENFCGLRCHVHNHCLVSKIDCLSVRACLKKGQVAADYLGHVPTYLLNCFVNDLCPQCCIKA